MVGGIDVQDHDHVAVDAGHALGAQPVHRVLHSERAPIGRSHHQDVLATGLLPGGQRAGEAVHLDPVEVMGQVVDVAGATPDDHEQADQREHQDALVSAAASVGRPLMTPTTPGRRSLDSSPSAASPSSLAASSLATASWLRSGTLLATGSLATGSLAASGRAWDAAISSPSARNRSSLDEPVSFLSLTGASLRGFNCKPNPVRSHAAGTGGPRLKEDRTGAVEPREVIPPAWRLRARYPT